MKLLKILDGEMLVLEMMAKLKLSGRRNFLVKYLSPVIEARLVEMTQPDSPRGERGVEGEVGVLV